MTGKDLIVVATGLPLIDCYLPLDGIGNPVR